MALPSAMSPTMVYGCIGSWTASRASDTDRVPELAAVHNLREGDADHPSAGAVGPKLRVRDVVLCRKGDADHAPRDDDAGKDFPRG